MGNNLLFIHQTDNPLAVPAAEVRSTVLAAAEAPLVSNPELEQLNAHIMDAIQDLIDDGHIYVESSGITGDRCIVINMTEFTEPELGQRISQVTAGMGLLMAFMFDDNAWAFGDETAEFTTSTNDWHADWASPRGIEEWLRYTTNNMIFAQSNSGTGVDFLVIAETKKPESFIQTIYHPTHDVYQVEVREDGPDTHYVAMVDNFHDTLAAFNYWITHRARTPEADWELADL